MVNLDLLALKEAFNIAQTGTNLHARYYVFAECEVQKMYYQRTKQLAYLLNTVSNCTLNASENA